LKEKHDYWYRRLVLVKEKMVGRCLVVKRRWREVDLRGRRKKMV
jgi:hypothetical protein